MTTFRAPLIALLFPLFPLLLGACAGAPSSGPAAAGGTAATYSPAEAWRERWNAPAPQQGNEQVRKSAAAMLEGIRRYDNGDFADAIARLDDAEIRSAPGPIRVEALKYIAFSHCVTRDLADCRLAFDTALGIDADFELGRGEGGHPMWGPVFEQAKAASEKGRVRATLGHRLERWRGSESWRPW
jgi:hypothetical protein